ncbi:MAG: penicillin-binding protein activator LpoB [Desulfobacteraceae bacterium]|nr:penicillin-binding protein activator LpoB [Desulfobacteraceae bacterium]MBC2718395.1 penicillin-binding protein activator LpoB [Desulfobacteraceae bacterium]
MKHHRIILMMMIIGIASFLTSCASTPKIKRIDVDKIIDISGRWNDTDSRLVAEDMIRDCLKQPFLESFKSKKHRMPTLIVGFIKNRSHEHINIQTFVKDLERALINSGQVQFVASKGERAQIREERLDMARHASEDTMKGPGEEVGADFMLIGVINTIRDEASGKAVMYYQVNLELIAMANNIKVWVGEKKIKKLIKKPGLSW